jgi:holo-[acyl-carrier protein] synthase
MIIGIGVDLVEIDRIAKSLRDHGARFRDRIFTPSEIAYCEQFSIREERYAARFAAKEAARKAIGAAAPVRALSWHDVEIISSPEGAPHLQFYGRAAELIGQLGVNRSHVSLSHAIDRAIAFVILEIVPAARVEIRNE